MHLMTTYQASLGQTKKVQFMISQLYLLMNTTLPKVSNGSLSFFFLVGTLCFVRVRNQKELHK